MAFLLAFALAALAAGALWVLVRPRRPAPLAPVPLEVPAPAANPPRPGDVAPAGPPAGWRGAAELAQAEREDLARRLERIPRPPRLLDQLLSREFVNSASARALADLIVADPVLAARVLKTVNSPYHGLRQPVGSVEQAVQHLGTTAIRVVCLRYLFVAAFPVDDFSRRRALQDGWACSALSADLAQHLWPALGLPDVGHWSSALVMSCAPSASTVSSLRRIALGVFSAWARSAACRRDRLTISRLRCRSPLMSATSGATSSG